MFDVEVYDEMIFFILVCICILALLLRNFKINLSNPILILLASWLIGILICGLNIFYRYLSLTTETLLFIFLFFIFSLVGFYIGMQGKPRERHIEYNYKRLLFCFNILFILSLFAFIVTVYKLGIPPAFGDDTDRSSYYLSNGGELMSRAV